MQKGNVQTHKLAIIGFGGVGQAVAEIVRDKAASLRALGQDLRIVAVADLYKGSVYHPEGLDAATLLEAVAQDGNVNAYPDCDGLVRGMDALATIRASNADTVVELTYTDAQTGQPAIDHCRAAFESGKHVVTSNKGPVALAYPSLARLATQMGVSWGIEGTVMSGTPALRMPLATLAGNTITEICGILNGTTNYILTRMEDGAPFAEALQEAQQMGYAEVDPTNDVDGLDVRCKVVILGNVLLGAQMQSSDVPCEGIRHLSLDDIARAKAQGKRWKLLARIVRDADGRVTAKVGPEMLPVDDPLASVAGNTNAITYTCDLSGPITLVGAGAGRIETGFAILIDLLNIGRGVL